MEPLAIMDAVPPAILTGSTTASNGPLKVANNNANAESSATMSSPVMMAQSQSTVATMKYAPPTQQLQFAGGVKRPAPFLQSQQQRQQQRPNPHQHHKTPQFIVNNSNDDTTPNFINVVTTTGQSSTAISSIAPQTNNFNNPNNNTNNSNAVNGVTNNNPYDNTAKPNDTVPKINANTTNNNNNNAITKTTSTTITPAEMLTPLNREGKNLSEKKIRRLEKNRLSARNCRRKKKEVTQTLQKEINILEGENLRLRLQLKIGAEAEQSSRQEQERVTEILDALLKSGASDTEIYANIEEFKEKFADYGRDCRSAIEFHLRNVKRLLMPTTTTNVAMRALRWGVDVDVDVDVDVGVDVNDVDVDVDVGVNDGDESAEGDGDSDSDGDEDNTTAGDGSKLEDEEASGNSVGGVESVANDEAAASMARTISNLKEGMKVGFVGSQTSTIRPSSIITGAVEVCPEIIDHQQSESVANSKAAASMAQTISNLKEGMKVGMVGSQVSPTHPSSIITGEVYPEAPEQQQPQGSCEISIVKIEDTDPGNGATADASSYKQPPLPTPSTISHPMLALSDTAALEPKALFQYLVNYLEVTPAQATALKDSRHVSQELDAALATALSMLEELQERLTRCGEDLDEEFSTIRSILSPRQAAKFLVWVANNEACMHMLNELWSKVYPEPIVMPTSAECGMGVDIGEVLSEDTGDGIGDNLRDIKKG